MATGPGPQGNRLRRVLDWLLEGYPSGVPPKDYIPLLALLRRRLTEEEVRQVAAEIAAVSADGAGAGADSGAGTGAGDRRRGGRSPDTADIGVRITRITDAMPSPDDIARVEEHLVRHHDWPVD